MSERPGTDNQYSRRFPPPEAWKQPDKWLNLETGLALPSRPRLELQIDENGLIKTDETVKSVKEELFWNDYDWPYIPHDQETAPDEHHFYFEMEEYLPENNEGNTVPWHFRTMPPHIGWFPRQFHNVWHDHVQEPGMPELGIMEDKVEAYKLALRAWSRLYVTAKKSIKAEQSFATRQRSLESGKLVPRSDDDGDGLEYMRSYFDTHFKSYAEAVEIFRATEHKHLVHESFERFEAARRKRVVQKVGQIIARNHVNYVPVLRNSIKAA